MYVTLVYGQVVGGTECMPARDDSHLVHRIGTGHKLPDQCVPRLVERYLPLLVVADNHALPFRPHHHLVLRLLDIGHGHLFTVEPCGQQRGLVHDIGQVGAGEARGGLCHKLQVYILLQGDVPRVDL